MCTYARAICYIINAFGGALKVNRTGYSSGDETFADNDRVGGRDVFIRFRRARECVPGNGWRGRRVFR